VSETRKFAQLAYLTSVMYGARAEVKAARKEHEIPRPRLDTRTRRYARGTRLASVRSLSANYLDLSDSVARRRVPSTHAHYAHARDFNRDAIRTLSQQSFISLELHLRPSSRCVTLEFRVKFMKLISLIINVNIYVSNVFFWIKYAHDDNSIG